MNTPKLTEYTIPVVWTVMGRMKIKAESLEAAILLAGDAPLPTNNSYVEDSFEIDFDSIGYNGYLRPE